MHKLIGLLLAVLLAASVTAQAQDASIRVGGSTTALPIISSCAAHFMEKFGTWDKAEAGLGKEQAVIDCQSTVKDMGFVPVRAAK